jgi:RNA polymerase sigma-70 factor (ECF subfamily)
MKSDAVLLASVRRMESEALIQVFDQYAPVLFKYALRTCQDAQVADQIVGDVFANLLDQLSCGGGPCRNLRAYLFEIAHHLLVDHIRQSGRQMPLDPFALDVSRELSAYPNLEQGILSEEMWQAVHRGLTESQRRVIVLRFLEGFSLRETAHILGKSVTLVKVTQSRAVATLRACLYHWVTISALFGEKCPSQTLLYKKVNRAVDYVRCPGSNVCELPMGRKRLAYIPR